MLADNGYFSGDNVEHCVDEEITPYIAVDREKHHVTIQERAAEPEPPSEPADAVEQMKHRLKTTQGRALRRRDRRFRIGAEHCERHRFKFVKTPR